MSNQNTLTINAWVSQNQQTSSGPGQSARSIVVSFVPEIAGKDANFAGGKVVGAVNLQNLTDEQAAEYSAGAEFEVVLRRKVALSPS